jgi:hypothetical protein
MQSEYKESASLLIKKRQCTAALTFNTPGDGYAITRCIAPFVAFIAIDYFLFGTYN